MENILVGILSILAIILVLIVGSITKENSIAADCDDFGKFRNKGNIYICNMENNDA